MGSESGETIKKDRVIWAWFPVTLATAIFLGEGREAFSVTALAALLLVSAGIVIVNAAPKKAAPAA